ncbi:hypothetical protein HID58_035636 [Brassica napus]|uniref:Uncharacterized protein n=1 Tax=Brassica napus TaxID=3708 RepID=A0ABQ8C5I1_BRANA|nr:hypothetical protein HID58_035636 [Brassica napus]
MGVDMLLIDPRQSSSTSLSMFTVLTPLNQIRNEAGSLRSQFQSVMFLSFITPFSGSKGTNEARNYRNGSHNSLTPPKDASKRLPLSTKREMMLSLPRHYRHLENFKRRERALMAELGSLFMKPNMETRLRNAVSKLFKLLMPTEKYTTGVKNMVLETLSSVKIEGFVDGFRGETKAASTEKTVDK